MKNLPDPANIIFGTMMYSADQMREYAQLVSRQAQPEDDCKKCGEDGGTSCGDPQCGLLTAEQPVPDSKLEPKYGADYEISYVQGWNDCRDEMIAAAQQKEKE